MSQPREREPLALPPPVGGMNRRDALSAMDAHFAQWLLNWEIEPQHVKVRGGYTQHATFSSSPTGITGLVPDGVTELYAWVRESSGSHKIYSVSSGTPSAVHTTGASNANDSGRGFEMAGKSWFVPNRDGANVGRYWDGSTWTAWGFDDGAAGDINPNSAVSHKGRIYLAQDQDIWYSAIDAVTGTCTQWNVSSLISKRPHNIAFLAVMGSPGDRADEQYLVWGTYAGEIFAYAGDNPGAVNWEQVGRFQVSPTLGLNCILEYRNDVLVMTSTGLVSVRKLFQEGSEAQENLTISSPVDPYWTDVIRQYIENGNAIGTAEFASIAYWPERNRIYCLLKPHIQADGTYVEEDDTIFVYNVITQGWAIHRIVNAGLKYLTYFDNALYFVSDTHDTIVKYDDQSFVDTYNNGVSETYTAEVHSAYSNLGSWNQFKRCTGIQPLINTDFNASDINVKVAADFGSDVSAATARQSIESGFSIPAYQVGVEGTHLQYRMDVSTNDGDISTGFELHSVGMIVR